MPRLPANGAEIFYEEAGQGDPLLLIHGSWTDHTCWEAAAQQFTEHFRVLTYDRRGHSQSERPSSQGSRREDEDDAIALLEALGGAPAHVAGNSFGASITLGLAARRPDLFRSAMAHEPPLLAMLANDPRFQPELLELQVKFQSVLQQLEGRDIPGGTRQFVEVALGPEMWEQLPARDREIFINNAPTFVDEMRDPEAYAIDLTALANFSGPVLLTQGDQSAPWYHAIVAKVDQAVAQAEVKTLPGGHIPHVTHPDDYAAAVIAFIRGSR